MNSMVASSNEIQSNSSNHLETLLNNNVLSQMSRSFKGMLCTQKLTFVSMKKDRALFVMSTNPVIANCGDQVFLHSPTGPDFVTARVVETNNYRGRLILGEFEFQDRNWIPRSHERVQPHKRNQAILICSDAVVPVSLESLSLNGVGVLAYRPIERKLEPHPGIRVNIEFRLPIGYGLFILSGIVVSVIDKQAGFVYMGVKTTPNVAQAKLLEYYINYRRQEIIGELNWAFSKTSGLSHSDELEF